MSATKQQRRTPDEQKAPARGLSGEACALVKAPPKYSRLEVRQSTNAQRCPWYSEVVELAARPGAWHAHAIIHAGAGAWERARETHDAGRRACTLLPPEADPAVVRWPAIKNWIGNAGDLPTATAIELARCLIDAGANLVQMIGDNIKPSLTMRRARNGN